MHFSNNGIANVVSRCEIDPETACRQDESKRKKRCRTIWRGIPMHSKAYRKLSKFLYLTFSCGSLPWPRLLWHRQFTDQSSEPSPITPGLWFRSARLQSPTFPKAHRSRRPERREWWIPGPAPDRRHLSGVMRKPRDSARLRSTTSWSTSTPSPRSTSSSPWAR